MSKNNTFKLRKHLWNHNKINIYYWFLLSQAVLLIMLLCSQFLWLDSQKILLKDIPGVERDFFNNFTNNGLSVYDTAAFNPRAIMFRSSSNDSHVLLLVTFILALIALVPWPLVLLFLMFVVAILSSTNTIDDGEFIEKNLKNQNYRRLLIVMILLVPMSIIIIIQGFYVTQEQNLTEIYLNQFLRTFSEYQTIAWSPQLNEQFLIAANGAKNLFNHSINNVWAIITIGFSFWVMLWSGVYSSFAMMMKFKKVKLTNPVITGITL